MFEFYILDVAWYYASLCTVWNLTQYTSLPWWFALIIGVPLTLIWMLVNYLMIYALPNKKKNESSDTGIITKMISTLKTVVILLLLPMPILFIGYTVAAFFHHQWDWSWTSAIIVAVPMTVGCVVVGVFALILIRIIPGSKLPLLSLAIYERYGS